MSSGDEAASNPQERAARPIKKVLLALDVSERTPEVIRVGSYLSRAFQAEAVAVFVVKMPTSVRADEFDGSPAGRSEEGVKGSLAHLLQQHYGENADQVQVKILHGDPADRIVEFAEYLSTDLIVIGSRGHGALARAILGSTSSAVASNSKSSVFIVK